MDAGDTLKITGSNVGIGARNKMVIRSRGGIFTSDITSISSGNSPLIPTSLSGLFNKIVENLLFDIV